MIANLHWTYTRATESYTVKDLIRHQTRPGRHSHNEVVGGLALPSPVWTRLIQPDGKLIIMAPENYIIELAVVGGCNGDYKCCNTMTRAQYQSLANELRSLKQSFPGLQIISKNFRNFDLELWIKAIAL